MDNENQNNKSKKLKPTNQDISRSRNRHDDLVEGLKMEIASELGIIDQVNDNGWHSLSPRLSGKVGGKLSQRLKDLGKWSP